jgi:hypothetical protein
MTKKKDFQINYKFNNLLIYLLSLELIIKLIHENIKLKLELGLERETSNVIYLNKLENILLVAIINYFKIIHEFNITVDSKSLHLEVPKKFSKPF